MGSCARSAIDKPVNKRLPDAKKADRVLCYPTQAKVRLEWGTQPLLLVQGVGVKAALDPLTGL
jgi:hypothetical protein